MNRNLEALWLLESTLILHLSQVSSWIKLIPLRRGLLWRTTHSFSIYFCLYQSLSISFDTASQKIMQWNRVKIRNVFERLYVKFYYYRHRWWFGCGSAPPPPEYKRRMENFGVRSPMTVECRPIFIDSAVAAKIYHLYHFCMVLIIESFYRKNMLGTVHKNGSGLSE